MCARHTIASGKHVFRTRSLHTYLWRENISWNRNCTTGMMVFSLLRVQDNNILPKWYGEITGLCFDCPEDGDLHIPSYHLSLPAAISIYGWRYQARHYCAYANGLSCLFWLRAAPFTLQIKLLHPCVNFLGTNYKNALQQVLCKLLFIYCLSFSKSFGKYWFKTFNETKSFNKVERLI